MSAWNLLSDLQADVASVLTHTPALADVVIHRNDEGDIEAKVRQSLAPLQGAESGKRGLCLVVLPPEVTNAERNLPGPPLLVKIEVQAIEHFITNRSTQGTHIKTDAACLMALSSLHHQVIGGHAFYAEDNPVQPVKVAVGYGSHSLTLYARANGVQGPGKPAGVNAAWITEDEVEKLQLQCSTWESEIYYTTDGSYPAPSNGTLYTDPIAGLAVGTVIRAAAYVTGMNPGDVTEIEVVPETDPNALTWDRFTPDWEDL